MRFKLLTPTVVAMGVLLVQVPFTACSSGDGCSDAGYDVSGDWYWSGFVTSASGSGCAVGPGDATVGYATLFQEGTSLTVYDDDGYVYEGTVCGDSVHFTWEGCDGALCGEEEWSLTLSDSDSEASGTAYASYTNSTNGSTCTANLDVYGARISPLVTDDDNNTAVVINERHDCGILVVMRPQGQGVGSLMPIGYVQPGGAVVFPLPSGSWEVFTAYPDEGAHHFDFLGEMTDPSTWAAKSEKGWHTRDFLLGSQ